MGALYLSANKMPKIRVTIYADKEAKRYISALDTHSIKTYVMNQLGKTDDAQFKKLLVDPIVHFLLPFLPFYRIIQALTVKRRRVLAELRTLRDQGKTK